MAEESTNQPNGDQVRRTRIALALMLLGLLFILAAWIVWYSRATAEKNRLRDRPVEQANSGALNIDEKPATAGLFDDGASVSRTADQRARVALWILMWGSILLIVYVGGSIIIIRTGRNVVNCLTRKKAEPTTAPDIWAMHRLPSDETADN